jgi:hypothetical protein
MKRKKKRQENFTDAEKQMIIQSYDAGIKATALSVQMKKSTSSISTFYSRWKLNSTLPAKVKLSKTKIGSRMSAVVKKVVRDNSKLGLNKLCSKIKEALPCSPWYPKKTCLRNFLANSGFKKRNPSLKHHLTEAHRAKRYAF